jgi:tRNA(fMet)-specific endonuclease VapC
MGVLVDTSVLIRAERGGLDLRSVIADRVEEPFFLSVVSASELLHGVHRAKDRAIRRRRSAFVEGVLQHLPILDIDLATARQHAAVWADLAARGELIGPHDLWLAATCLAHGHSIATANVREFERVPGLRVERWGD